MINRRSYSIICLFLVITVIVIFQAVTIKRTTSSYSPLGQEERVQFVELTGLVQYTTKENRPDYKLKAEKFIMRGGDSFWLSRPVGFFFSEKGTVHFVAAEGTMEQDKEHLFLKKDVNIFGDTFDHKAQSLFYDLKKSYVKSAGKVRSVLKDEKTEDVITVDSLSMETWIDQERSLFKKKVQGDIKRHRKYEQSFSFKGDLVEVNLLDSVVNLSQDVELRRKNFIIKSQKAEIFLENFNKKLKYYVLYDDVFLQERLQDRKKLRRAYAEKLEGYMSEGKVVLSGAPRVEQEEDLIRGYQIILRENIELVEVDDSRSSFNLQKDK